VEIPINWDVYINILHVRWSSRSCWIYSTTSHSRQLSTASQTCLLLL